MNGSIRIFKADGSGEVRELSRPPSLKELQEIVGGYIELVPMFETFKGADCVAYCNEEGKLMGLPINRLATLALVMAVGDTCGDVLCGDVAILTGDAEFMESL